MEFQTYTAGESGSQHFELKCLAIRKTKKEFKSYKYNEAQGKVEESIAEEMNDETGPLHRRLFIVLADLGPCATFAWRRKLYPNCDGNVRFASTDL